MNLRTAVAALSPIFEQISVDIPLSSLDVGIIGTLPPLCFALFGLLAPLFQRYLRVESLLIVALAAMVCGDVLRALSGSFPSLVLASALTFAGMGVGNVLLPPLVKKYFPDRIGLVTSLYATVMSVFSLLPPLTAVPLSDAVGWRFSVGVWSVLAVVAIVPWIRLLGRDRRRVPDPKLEEGVLPEADSAMLGRARRSPIAWGLAIVFGVTALNSYSGFTWLPEILTDVAGVDQAGAGALLSIYTGMGIPASLLIPVIAGRVKNVTGIILFGVVAYLVGYLGLLLAPGAAPWFWVACAGTGPMLFPLVLLLINKRSRTQRGSVALSGFVQGLGYVIGALGPLVVGVLHQLTGNWTVPLLFLLASVGVILLCARVVSKPAVIEDQWVRQPDRV
ncbi:MFS transporter [Subtercola sp. Z020]|nr:MFS transporter [Subtercola sp. Z020]